MTREVQGNLFGEAIRHVPPAQKPRLRACC